ncbi:SAM-dependent methyltransferase [Streptomyces fuscichromogenes]|uniref:Cyclopropane-fatty-acyl-phospholipid synthase n=1 Tax=Streptomyces fuscichromogenes TaxID=1324013 RepID=A0A917XLM4_9ACTN|nr:cyclopropane-fatty-acyl-phospholipid synthase family protein [Streptomyces fuscichromogenes]GGN37562.1 cyclopropane-fatty-acyl-phospholipid synthase [Streptomyces fuscichromogenes]
MADAASRLRRVAEQVLGAPLPVRLRAWDGSQDGPPDAPTLVVRNRRALRHMLFKPGELGMARAWVAGDLDIEGDLYSALAGLSGLIWERGEGGRTVLQALRDPAVRAAVGELLKLAGPPLPPAPPREETRRRRHLHTRRTDRQAISHHYDVGNDFYELVLGPSMVYSCAYWGTIDDAATLEGAQRDKLELVCAKLGLTPGQRLLDVGCGWGSLAIHAAREHGVSVVGVTLSQEQAAYARKRVADEGLTDRVEIRVQDYRDVRDGPYDAISSIGMAEHVGADRYLEYARELYGLLRPGGRLLNHQIARRPQRDESAYDLDEFIDAYVFPDGELAPVGTTVTQLERAGFEVRDVESIREHYARTLRQWVANLEAGWPRAVRLTTPGRARVWRLYMAASALGFEHNRIGVNQVLAVRTPETGASGLPLRTRTWN